MTPQPHQSSRKSGNQAAVFEIDRFIHDANRHAEVTQQAVELAIQ